MLSSHQIAFRGQPVIQIYRPGRDIKNPVWTGRNRMPAFRPTNIEAHYHLPRVTDKPHSIVLPIPHAPKPFQKRRPQLNKPVT